MADEIEQLAAQIPQAWPADQDGLRKLARAARRRAAACQPFDRLQKKLAAQVQASLAKANRRQQARYKLEYDEQLPIVARKQEIMDAITAHQVVIVCGETGSGKSTQLPKFCLELGRGSERMIGHTQPRRIAARSVAARVAEELGSALGQVAGFKTRFSEALSDITHIKLMTDGILLAETQTDAQLHGYDTIIIDEAHERSLNIDFLLGLIKRILPQRPDLKLIITSATIDAERFAEHFADANGQPAPVLEVSGRTYPVEVRYRPVLTDDDADETQALREAVRELAAIDRGDILIFMPTEHDIREAAKTLRGMSLPGDGGARETEILPLYARLSVAEQNRVFQPHQHRRIVIATNVAESSLTVPGIHYVIDTGTARISRYSPRSKVQRLPIEAISRASADQRAGRCGRIAPGVCIRMYAREDYESRDRFTAPEIQRTNLAAVILQTLAFRLGPIEDFPFLDPPKPAAIRDGYKTLFELGAIDSADQLTQLGKRLSRLPVDPRIGRMILAGAEEDCLAEILVIAAALEVNDPRDRPVERQGSADEAHARHHDPNSDFLGMLKLWHFTHGLQEELSRNRFRKALQQNFISFNRLREWYDVHRQLRQVADQAGLKVKHSANVGGNFVGANIDDKLYEPIHRALLTGLLSNVAFRSERHEYNGAGGMRLAIWPGSGVFSSKPNWMMAAELVETTKRYARTVAKIDPAWVEDAAPHLVKRSYSNPRWDSKTAAAVGDERVSLFGLPVVPKRRVRIGRIDPVTARELFIEHALLAGDFQSRAAFLKHNRQVIAEAQTLQAKTRRYDLLGDERDLFKFYQQRLPQDVVDGASFERWWRKDESAAAGQLSLTLNDLLRADAGKGAAAKDLAACYPDRVEDDGLTLPAEYRFAPGEDDDGVTLVVPQAAVHQLDERRLGWLIPGLWEQQVTAMIKSLPKHIRVNLVPAPQTAAQVVKDLDVTAGGFVAAVADELSRIGGVRINPVDFDPAAWPQHLRVNVRVVDERGKTLSQGRDLAEIRAEIGGDVGEHLATLEHPDWNQSGVKDWAWELLPQSVEVRHRGMTLRGFPMIVDEGDAVATRLAPTLDIAEAETRRGLRRLLLLKNWRNLKQQIEHFPKFQQMQIYAAHLRPFLLTEELALRAVELAFLGESPLPRTADAFNRLQKSRKGHISLAVQDVTALAEPMLTAMHQAIVGVGKLKHAHFESAREDLAEQIAKLTPPGFFHETPWEQLQHYPRYFRGIVMRLEKLNSGGRAKDAQNLQQLRPFLARFADRSENNGTSSDTALERYRWMLEEFRVSLFAQSLGTAESISAKRLDAQWEKVGG